MLDALRQAPTPVSVGDLARTLDLHPNTIRFHLDGLVADGQVEPIPGVAVGPGRPPARFRVRRRMDPNGPANHDLLARLLVGHLATTAADPAATAAAIGRAWGAGLIAGSESGSEPGGPSRAEAVERMVGTLADLGFAPERPSTGTQIRLRHCPFLAMVDADATGEVPERAVVCGVHLGLMDGAFAAMGAPVTVRGVEAFAEADVCVAHLADVGAAGGVGRG